MVKEIIINPNPILKKPAKEVLIDELKKPDIKNIINDLVETMYASDGVGIAAPQIGQSFKICIIAKQYAIGFEKDLVLINPVWAKSTILKKTDEEGCLSVPNTYGKVSRYKKIKVKAIDENGKSLEFGASNFFARIIQHEVDHLNGILFIDKAKKIYNTEQL